MKLTHLIILTACLSAGTAFAQAGAASGPGPGASAPGMGMGMGKGMGPGGGRGPMGRWGADNTPGWTMMTPQERSEHQNRMRSMTSYDECKTYQAQHHEQMMARAKERGAQLQAAPRRDPCAGLKR